ncbi:MAG TPA: hypothetical protein H9668_06085 [Firmicutes bacterium]|nr:hypothetical protein [Bacillota bacterium]
MDTQSIQAPFQFLGSKITKVAQTNTFDYLDSGESLKRYADVNYSIDEIAQHDNLQFGTISLYVKLQVLSSANHYDISVDIQGTFFSDLSIDNENFKKMLGINGCTVLYSIVRAFIISLSSQSLIGGQIILPMINTFKLIEKKETSGASN